MRNLARTALCAALLGVAGCSSGGFKDAFGLSKQAPDESKVRVTQPLAMPPDYTLHAPDTSRPPVEPGRRVPPLNAQRQRAGAQPPGYGQGTPATINPQYPQYPQQQPGQQAQPNQQAAGGGPASPQQPRYPSQPVYQPQAPQPPYSQYPSQPVYQPQAPQPNPVQNRQAGYPQAPAQARQPQPYPVQNRQAGYPQAPAQGGQPRPVNAPTRVASANPQAGAPAPADVYQQYGISKVNPDGTPKSKDQLRDELRKAYIKKRKAQNPKYGTVWNFWNAIFGD